VGEVAAAELVRREDGMVQLQLVLHKSSLRVTVEKSTNTGLLGMHKEHFN
jgi:hypothetical protein